MNYPLLMQFANILIPIVQTISLTIICSTIYKALDLRSKTNVFGSQVFISLLVMPRSKTKTQMSLKEKSKEGTQLKKKSAKPQDTKESKALDRSKLGKHVASLGKLGNTWHR